MPIREIPEFTLQSQNPGKCSFCNMDAQERPHLAKRRSFTTGLHIHMEGDIQVCSQCIEEWASLIGCGTAGQLTARNAEIDQLKASLNAVNAELSRAAASKAILLQELAAQPTFAPVYEISTPEQPAAPAKRGPGRPRKAPAA